MTKKSTQEIVQEAIYQTRWIDAIKDGSMATDEAIAKAVVNALDSQEWEYAVEVTKVGYPSGVISGHWTRYLENAREECKTLTEWHRRHYMNPTGGRVWYTYKVVGRPRAKPYVEIPDTELERKD